MPSTYLDTPKDSAQPAMPSADQQKSGAQASASDQEAPPAQDFEDEKPREKPKLRSLKSDINLPSEVRRAFAVKVWVLLGLQLFATGVCAAVFDRVMPNSNADVDPEDEGYGDLMPAADGALIWLVSAFMVFIMLAILRVVRHKVPINFIFLAITTPVLGIFWGATKYILVATFSLNLLFIVAFSLIITTVWWATGLVQCLGKALQPKPEAVEAAVKALEAANAEIDKVTKDDTLGSSENSGSEKGVSKLKKQSSRIAGQARAQLRAENDGMSRATLFFACISWMFASAADIMFIKSLLQGDTEDKIAMRAAVFAVIIGLFMSLWFHGDAVWHIRKCNTDEYLSLLIDVNTDIFTVIVAFFACAVAIACGEASSNDPAVDVGGQGAGVEGAPEGSGATGTAEGRIPMGEVNIEGPNRQAADVVAV